LTPLPQSHDRFQELVAALAKSDDRSYAFAELADYLRVLPVREFQRAVAFVPKAKLDSATLNHLAGMIELASERRDVEPPGWTREVPIPAMPTFGSSLASVRLYLLTRAPVAFRRRNIFVDASIDERV
jgi:hypothetical protein